MTDSITTGIDSLIQSREKREGVIGGEYLAFIGLLMTATYLINALVISHFAIWAVSIALGWVAILTYEKVKAMKDGHYATRIQKEILSIWTVIGGFAVPAVLIILPALLELYPGEAIIPLTYLVLGIGVWLTGAVAKSGVFKVGGVFYFAGMFISPVLSTQAHQMILFFIVMFAGLIIPGIVSKVHEK